LDGSHSLEEGQVSLASGEGGDKAGLHITRVLVASGAAGRFVASLVVLANVGEERRLDGALIGVTVSANGGDVRDVGVRGVQIGSELSNGMFPSISLRAGSAVSDTRRVGGGTSL